MEEKKKEEYIKLLGKDLGEKLYLVAKQLEKVDKLEKEIEELKKKIN